ncbi:hypothetical protein [Clostridium uliginosum]|uniref:Uncharacterized protein n=1 Tax=Clostridium uliginosum TaxID=119641 RepID=A0A1I1NP87_9CLOT|nr:hypothetical protein [Clostridium uliginosum]SFC99236.1 hypothetical protein SAMN05421842_11616 [Clostridium uliginosum]
MTLPEITQENVHLFIPFKVAKVTGMIIETEHNNLEDALIEIYNSKVYSDLEKEETKLWHEGATYIYESLKDEKQNKVDCK